MDTAAAAFLRAETRHKMIGVAKIMSSIQVRKLIYYW